jgi:nucleotidyltransferase/DNA polymerase involved in DNA repair
MLRQGNGSGGSDFAVNGAAPLPPPPLNGRSQYIDDDTYNEDMDDDLWDDLAGLHDPSHPAAKQQRSRNNRKSVVVTGAGGINYTNHHTNTLSAGAAPSTTSIPTIPTATDRNPTDNKHVSCSQPRVIIHCDIDSFYCSVERLDDPTLRNLPLAVEQFNSGGFVAVSYEARAAGIRCGDGAGAAGRAVIPHLAAMKARSIEECKIACPGLVVCGMRPQRYREVGRAIQEMLKSLVGSTTTMVPVEKASCDDFYLDVTALCSSSDNAFIDTLNLKEQQLGLSSSFSNILERFPDGLKFIYLQKKNEDADNKKSAAVWSTVSPDLQRGVYIAHAIRQTLSQKLGLTASCAVSRNKLISRLASPTNKPNGLTLVASDAAAVDFIGDIPITSVPSMQRKFGTEVQEALGDIKLVKDLVKFEKKDLEAKFGPARGKFLSNLPAAIDTTPVAERGPPKSITSERSFPPAKNQDAVLSQIKTLVEQLLLRGALDVAEHSRLPSKLGIGFRLGYDTNLISRSGAVPLKVLTWLRSSITSSANTTPPAGEVVDAAADAVLILLRGAANGRWDITRAAVVLHYGDVGNSRSEHTGPTIGELFKATVAEKDSSKKEEIKKNENAAGPSSKEPQKQIPSTYRNAEALALQAIFSGSGSGGGGDNNNQSIPSILKNNKDNDDDLDKASLELALKLQREEAGVVDLSSNRIKTSSSKKKNARGPLDNFFIIPKPKP